MTDVILYAIELKTLAMIIISIPILVFISSWIYFSVRDDWMKRDHKLLREINKEIEKYQGNRWDIEEDIEYAKLLINEDDFDKLFNIRDELNKLFYENEVLKKENEELKEKLEEF